MINPSLEALMKKMDSKYALVIAAAKRAREIMADEDKNSDKKSVKSVTLALQEIAEGKLRFERPNAGIK